MEDYTVTLRHRATDRLITLTVRAMHAWGALQLALATAGPGHVLHRLPLPEYF